MNTIHKGMTVLLRSAVTGEKLTLPEDFRLEDADALIRSQSLVPMIYLGAFNCGVSTETELMRRYKQQYFQALLRHEQQMRAVDSICRAFAENGIDYVLLKGCILKPLYPNPEMRVMGDADILIRKEQYEKIKAVMTGLGFQEGEESLCDISWKSAHLLTELHHRIYGEAHSDLLRYFENIWEKAEQVSENRYQLSSEDHYLHIFSHMAKHFRQNGIGARQLADIYVYRNAHPEMDTVKIKKALDLMGLTVFHQKILRLLDVWFAGAETDPLTDAITAYIFSSGSWGNTETRMYTEALVHASGKAQQAKGQSLLRMIFPKLTYMQSSYGILLRHPWLQPVFWVVRWFDILLHRRRNIGKRMHIFKNMSSDKVSERKAFLDAVGLDFYEQ